MEENKSVAFKIEGGKLLISVDLNKDGQTLVDIAVDLAEIPDEILQVFKKKK